MIYSNKLKEIRKKNNTFQKEIADHLNISRSLYGRYEKEYLIMPIEHLIKTADFFHISIDFLLELTEEENHPFILETDKIKAGKKLKEFRKENKITQEKLAQILNTTQGVIANYERGRNFIATPFLYTICKKYHVSADYLLGKIDEPKYY